MTKVKDLKFEDAMLALEDSISRLESGNLALDESISEFENAVKLIKVCETKLSSAKQKVRILIEGEDGVVTDKPFDSDSYET